MGTSLNKTRYLAFHNALSKHHEPYSNIMHYFIMLEVCYQLIENNTHAYYNYLTHHGKRYKILDKIQQKTSAAGFIASTNSAQSIYRKALRTIIPKDIADPIWDEIKRIAEL